MIMKKLSTALLLLIFFFNVFCKVNGQTTSTSYIMSNDLDSVVFNLPLSTSDNWKITAETTIFQHAASPNGAYNTWGSALLAQGSNPIADYYNTGDQGFQYYWAVNGGQLTLKNGSGQNVLRPSIAIDETVGVDFRFEITCYGDGVVQLDCYVNGEEVDSRMSGVAISVITCVSKASKYPEMITVEQEIPNAVIFPVADINFNEALVGETATKTFTAKGFGLTGNITATVGGTDAAAFAVSPSSVANGGTVTVTFSPTEKKVYNATITLSADGAEPVIFNLTGNSNFDLPVIVSSDDNSNEHWYYLQFARKASANLVWSLSDTTRMVVQDTLIAGVNRQDQQWKICGDWGTGYYIVNRATGKEVAYNTKSVVDDGGDPRVYTDVASADQYVMFDGFGDNLGFALFKGGTTWQLYNQTVTKYNAPTQNYINDKAGASLCNYLINDAGNELIFISAADGSIVTTVSSLTIKAPANETAVSPLNVIGMGLNAAITATITGADASVFSISPASLPAEGGMFNITFAPTSVNNNQTATLTLTSGGSQTEISLTGNSDLGLPVFSSADNLNETWYYMQFVRKATGGAANQNVVIQGNGIDQLVSQADTLAEGQSDNYAQQWKFVGNYHDGFYIYNRQGGQMTFSMDDEFYMLTDMGDLHNFYANTTSQWQIVNAEKDDDPDGGANYINDWGGLSHRAVGLYYVNDAGNYLIFIPVDDNNTGILNPSIDSNDTAISIKYYTLGGVQIKQPTGTGIYIMKKVFASGKTQATKILYQSK